MHVHPLQFSAILSFLCSQLLVTPLNSLAQQKHIGLFEGRTDVGTIIHTGSVTYDPASQTYALEGSGSNMWFGNDEFSFLWRRLQGISFFPQGSVSQEKESKPTGNSAGLSAQASDPPPDMLTPQYTETGSCRCSSER
jgi:hypothetical protein